MKYYTMTAKTVKKLFTTCSLISSMCFLLFAFSFLFEFDDFFHKTQYYYIDNGKLDYIEIISYTLFICQVILFITLLKVLLKRITRKRLLSTSTISLPVVILYGLFFLIISLFYIAAVNPFYSFSIHFYIWGIMNLFGVIFYLTVSYCSMFNKIL